MEYIILVLHDLRYIAIFYRYKVILCKPNLPGTRENCVKILKATKIQGWQVGKTKVFLKYYHLDQMVVVLEKMGESAILLQVGIYLY